MQHTLGVESRRADAVARLSFDLDHDTVVSVRLEDPKHHVVKVLMEGMMHNGHHDITWFGKTGRSTTFYLVIDTATDHRETKDHELT